ncbi:hypothetical protein D7Y05_14730 [bacterium 1XD42-54]|nr:hypothetical protein D7Y05_14730 [bacterium 1XD42-54]
MPEGEPLCYNTEVAKLNTHVDSGDGASTGGTFDRSGRAGTVRQTAAGSCPVRAGLFGSVRHAEENNQKEKRHERNFNETVT